MKKPNAKRHSKTPIRRNAQGEPIVMQGLCNGWDISWNPDTNMFHADKIELERSHIFKEWRNVLYFARTH